MRIPMPAVSSCGRNGRYLTGDTGYAGLPSARNHNTMTFGGVGQGVESQHDVWREMPYRALDGIRIREATLTGGKAAHRRRSRRGLSRHGRCLDIHAHVHLGWWIEDQRG